MGILKNEMMRLKGRPVGFGAASISGTGGGYGFGDISTIDSVALLHHAYDLGIKLFDTAPIYGFGESERRIGKAFKGKMRDEIFLVSKSGVTWDQNKRVDMNNDPKIALKMLETSLIDLNTEMIDLYMVHWPDDKYDIRSVLEVYAKAQIQGKIRFIGLCNTNASDLERASEVAKIDVVQSEFNLFNVGLQQDFLPILESKNISFMSWGTLDKGILTGRVNERRTFDKSDCRSWAPWWKTIKKEPKYQAVRELQKMLEVHNYSLLEFALSFNLSTRPLEIALCGARTIEQMTSVVDSLNHLPPENILVQGKKIADDILKNMN